MHTTTCSVRRSATAATLLALACAAGAPARAADVFVSPVRAELRAPGLSETITVNNRGSARMRVSVKLMEWTQDAQGNDVYKDTGDLVYFPRQMELEPEAKRQVRVGATAPAAGTEKTYRLFIEELPDPNATAAATQVNVYFRMGVPVFVPPVAPHPQPEIGEPVLAQGKLSLAVKNPGNEHIRVLKIVVDDGAGFSREIAGWYTLAGAQKTYALDLPREVCRKAKTLSIAIEGEGIRADRKLNVDPSRCS